MTHFIRDNTSPGDPKTTSAVRADIPAAKKISAAEWNVFRQALLDIQSYLRDGVLDAGTTVTVADIDLTADSNPLVGPELDYIGHSATWFIGVDVANAPTSRDFVATGVRGTYSFPDGATTSGSATLTSASGGGFKAGLVAAGGLVGATISGAGIPPGTTITAVGGATSLTMSANATATATGVSVTIARNTVQDLLYWKHRGGLSPTLGIGVTPPNGSARLQVSPQDDEPTMGTARFRVGPTQTAKAIVVHDSVPTDRWWVDKDFYLTGDHPTTGGAIAISADPTNQHALTITDSTKTNFYSFDLPTGSGGVMRFRCQSGGASSYEVGTNGSLRHLSTQLGFYGAAAANKPTVTGSRGGNAALASLLTALATLGLITDSTS